MQGLRKTMAKLLIIDSNDHRRRSLTARLRGMSQIVSSMSMICSDNLSNIVTSNDAIILLDQNDQLARQILSGTVNPEIKCILNNVTLIDEIELTQNIIILTEEGDELEQAILDIIDSAYSIHPRKQPIAVDPGSLKTFSIAKKVAKSNATVLISGETGTGKEVLAQYIHHYSPFSKGRFISVNCAALPDNMIEAILFGYEKGAFTGAVNTYIGKFEQAQNGTLLLDEISELSIGLQAKLLRVLQERELERLGGKKIIKINTRIIAATNRDLRQQVIKGEFRKDLYYRLNVVPLHCLSLKERPLDIIPVAEYFINEYTKLQGRSIPCLSDLAKVKLMNYRWHGNIREMENVIQRTLIMTDHDVIDEGDIQIDEHLFDFEDKPQVHHLFANPEKFNSKLEESEAKVIIDTLKEADGCRNDAAKHLNISPRTLRYKIAKLRSIGLKVP